MKYLPIIFCAFALSGINQVSRADPPAGLENNGYIAAPPAPSDTPPAPPFDQPPVDGAANDELSPESYTRDIPHPEYFVDTNPSLDKPRRLEKWTDGLCHSAPVSAEIDYSRKEMDAGKENIVTANTSYGSLVLLLELYRDQTQALAACGGKQKSACSDQAILDAATKLKAYYNVLQKEYRVLEDVQKLNPLGHDLTKNGLGKSQKFLQDGGAISSELLAAIETNPRCKVASLPSRPAHSLLNRKK